MRDTLEHHVAVLLQAVRESHADVPAFLRSHGAASCDTTEQARALVAHEHGYADWTTALAQGETRIDARFEHAVDAVVAGDVALLRRSLAAAPELVHARSSYPHHSTLLHHVAANGIENTRQWASPKTAPEIARVLLAAGADPDATCDVYGRDGSTTPLCLLVSSVHPYVAGVQADLVQLLCEGGAHPDGIDGYLPMWTATLFGCSSAAERLAKCGARADDIVFAAVLGDVDRVKHLLAGGRASLTPPAGVPRIGPKGPALPQEHLLELALIYAAAHARLDVVELLLAAGADPTVREPMYQGTALGMAKYAKDSRERPEERRAVIALLEARSAAHP
jgi:ankyrin repeat protein